MSRDVLLGLNRFMYAGNSPVMLVDPRGLREHYKTYPPGWHACPSSHCIPPRLTWYEQTHDDRQKSFNSLPGQRSGEDYSNWVFLSGVAAYMASSGKPNASKAFRRFLSRQGGSLQVDLEDILRTSAAMHQIVREDREKIRWYACGLQPGSHKLTDGLYEEVYTGSDDWANAVGRMVLWPDACVKVRCGQWKTVEIDYTLHLWDPFWWWDNQDYYHLHVVGLAREFVHTGQLCRQWRSRCGN